MSRRNGPKLDLKLNLSPPRANSTQDEQPGGRPSSPMSPPSSCVSSEANSPEAASMMLVGCPRCLMYVILSEEDPKCPKCKSTVLLDVVRENDGYRRRRRQRQQQEEEEEEEEED